MNKHFFKKTFLLVAVGCAVLLFLGADAIAASKSCSMVGSWFGAAGDNTWFVIATRGSSATVGQLYVQWTRFDPGPDVRVSDWMGVWEKVDNGLSKWTAVFYTYDAAGVIASTNRISGTSSFTDCDHTEDNWTWEIWQAGHDMNTDPPDICFPGNGTETRMLLVEPVCE